MAQLVDVHRFVIGTSSTDKVSVLLTDEFQGLNESRSYRLVFITQCVIRAAVANFGLRGDVVFVLLSD